MEHPTIRILPDQSIEGIFLHGVDLKNRMLVHNLGISGRLFTTDVLGTVDVGIAEQHRVIDEITVDELAFWVPAGNVVAPRVARYFVPASILESGQTLVNGYDEPINLSEKDAARIIEIRDVELAFEEGRRRLAPNAPSRLTCIWLAANDSRGEGVVIPPQKERVQK